ncbi:MAG: peptidoglycan-binding protein [Lachnospiraceae bacterium]|nr:peptidoglycan-binding protein [Lachnospiraceae bacterium]
MSRKAISIALVICMMLTVTACGRRADDEQEVSRKEYLTKAIAAVSAASEEEEGTVVDDSTGSLLYSSIGMILAAKAETREAGGVRDEASGYSYDELSLGYKLVNGILMDKQGQEQAESNMTRGAGLSGFEMFTETAALNTEASESDEETTPHTFTYDDEEDPDALTVDLSLIDIENTKYLASYSKGVFDHTVAIIQQRLMDLGFMDPAEPTEYYGTMTTAAVQLFQRQNDLIQDGCLEVHSLTLLLGPDVKSYLIENGMRGPDIVTIQSRLYELGYLSSQKYITGFYGDITEAAVRKMQEANSFVVNGTIDLDMMEMLYSESIKANVLSLGDQSDIIRACQERLRILGYFAATPDGYYGDITLAAVKLFQARNDLIVDGYLGPTTREKLDSSSAVENSISLGDEGDTVKRIQQLLAKWGYMRSGSATGYYGEVTTAAVKSFQRANGLTVDGDVGAKTLAKLTSDNVVRGEISNEKSSDNNGGSGSGTVDTGSTVSGSVKALLKVAKSKLGCKYVWGAKGPNTFDCSGFVYWCLNQIGVKQSYITSYGWRTVGKYQKITKYSSLKAGDIIVVTGHVGIVAEDGTVVDASSTNGKIMHRSLNSWWKDRFICGWRIFD